MVRIPLSATKIRANSAAGHTVEHALVSGKAATCLLEVVRAARFVVLDSWQHVIYTARLRLLG